VTEIAAMDYALLRKLYAPPGSDNANEAETARAKIKELLAAHGKGGIWQSPNFGAKSNRI
jgi:hypothetical protein